MKIGSTAAEAMKAFGTSVAVTANNLANINTDGFKAGRANLETGADGQGVRVSSITEDQSSGPIVSVQENETVEGSNTDVTIEMVNLTINENAFGANANVIRTEDEMVQTVLDMKV